MNAPTPDASEASMSEAERPELGEDGVVVHLDGEVDPLLVQWARWRDDFASAMEGFWTIEDLEQRIAHRRAFFFPGDKAAMVGQVEVYPDGARAFQVTWAVGDVNALLAMAPGVESVARMMGCTDILIEGREAWRKLLAPLGYDLFSVTVHKAL